ncbi:MAG: hypothetical protein IT374_26250 [Polyangiaceae bacterium]|nr:hypothetical protein [Polyangiaceae bacterium]
MPETISTWIAVGAGGALVAALGTLAGAIAYLYREGRADQRKHVETLRETLTAHAPTAETLAKVTTTTAVHAERLDQHDEQIERLHERVERWEDRTPAGPKASRR